MRRYSLGEVGVGLARLGYGVPGMILGPVIGRAADRWGRRWLVPSGLAIAAFSATLLIFDVPLLAAGVAVTILSLGYDMTQPLLAGIVTSLDPKRGGQAMGLNVFFLFSGFGLGSILFGEALRAGFGTALVILAALSLHWRLLRSGCSAAKAPPPCWTLLQEVHRPDPPHANINISDRCRGAILMIQKRLRCPRVRLDAS